jgi:hypothetical protein
MNILFNIFFTARFARAESTGGGFSFDLSGDNHKSKTPSLRLKRKIQLLLICIAIPNKMV